MARWVVSPIVGTGTSEDPYRPKAAAYATDWTALVPESTLASWCLVRATAGDLVAAEADADLIVLPQLSPGHVLTTPQRTWLSNRLTARGFATGWVVEGITVREALRIIGRWLDATFDMERLGAVDATG